ncbi:GMP synthase [Commensalibacter communis]|uniref:glutamine amidotransferase n=1 Tax=Commensalibacter communis TaxID=2972786 RepID=UPI0022FFA578|nr:glutamine amidotransferase [Commensalibacter communis]CAI3931768.1 GMP synthase [Commensalibacter communis]
MKKLLVIRHLLFEDLGIFEDELIDIDFQIQYVEAPIADFNQLNIAEYDLLIILGGPIGAFDEELYPFIVQELSFIQNYLETEKPILGICLGAQLIARLLGAKVYPMQYKEIGFSTLTINKEVINNPLISLENIPILHWHGDQFDIPANCQPLASSTLCPNQAFSYKDHVLALQFHMEVNTKKIEQWLVGHNHELITAKIDLYQLRIDAKNYGQLITRAGKATFVKWLAQIESK